MLFRVKEMDGVFPLLVIFFSLTFPPGLRRTIQPDFPVCSNMLDGDHRPQGDWSRGVIGTTGVLVG